MVLTGGLLIRTAAFIPAEKVTGLALQLCRITSSPASSGSAGHS